MEDKVQAIVSQIESAVLGKHEQVLLALSCLLAKGHLLIEDLPGMGKTTLAHALANSIGLSYQRVQFTSDLLPSDVIGISVFNQESGFEFHPGPIFNQVVLADEINRASPKTQSALLEAMEEKQVSIDGTTHPLAQPFFVIATQNPLHHLGTFPLPESQLDRFLMRICLGFPSVKAERELLREENKIANELGACISPDELVCLQENVTKVTASDAILDYVLALVNGSRHADFPGNPLSPRASKAIVLAAKAWAYIKGRNYVIPDDVKAIFASVCEHRLGHTLGSSGFNAPLSEQLLETIDVLSPTA